MATSTRPIGALLVLALMLSACSVAVAGSESAAIVVREPTITERNDARDVSKVFQRTAARFDSGGSLSNLFLLGDHVVESDKVNGWAFDAWHPAGDTHVILVPSDDLERPEAIVLLLDQSRTSKIAPQAMLTALAVTEEAGVNDAVMAHFENTPSQVAEFAGVNHTIRFAQAVPVAGGTSAWVATFVQLDSDLDHGDLVAVARAVAAGPTGPAQVSDSSIEAIEFNEHFIATRPDLRLGMSFDEFRAITGLETTQRVSFRWYAEEDFGDLGSALYTFDPELGLHTVVHQFRMPVDQVAALAAATFGPQDPNMPDLRALSGSTKPAPASWTGQWLLPVPGHDDVWAITFDSSIMIRSTMPGTEYNFPTAD